MKVLNLVDHLHHGGVQRMAVNIANSLSNYDIDSHLCTIMDKGELKAIISDRVHHFSLSASSIYSFLAARRLTQYCKLHNIDIIHAHHLSLYLAFQAFLLDKKVKIIWHDHYGRQELRERPWLIYYLMTRRVNGIISVSQQLKNWAIKSLKKTNQQVEFIPNFIDTYPNGISKSPIQLPGKAGYRIVCVANFRPHKDHLTLIRGFRNVVDQESKAHLILIGIIEDRKYYKKVKNEIEQLNLKKNITYLGKFLNVFSVLLSSDVGVLSSSSEGLPLTLIEYGIAGLPVVCTDVGDCSWLIKNDERGLLIHSCDPKALEIGVLTILRNKNLANYFSDNLQSFIDINLSKNTVIQMIINFYNKI